MSSLLRSKKKKENGQTCISWPCIWRSPYTLRLLDNSQKVDLYRAGHLSKTDTVLPPLDSQNARLHYFLPVYKGQQIGLRSNHAANFAVSSKVHGKMNSSEIVKSINLFIVIEWRKLQALDELNIQFSLQETYI